MSEKKITQKDKIISHLQTGNPVSDSHALSIGIKRLSAIINKLREEQWVFTTKNIAQKGQIPNCEYTATYNPTASVARAYKIDSILYDEYPDKDSLIALTELLADILCWCDVNDHEPSAVSSVASGLHNSIKGIK